MSEPRELVLLSEGTRMLAEARSLDELRLVRDLAHAAAAYAKARGLGVEARQYAVEIEAIASRRMAELDPPAPHGGPGGGSAKSAFADIAPQRRSENRDLLVLSEDDIRQLVSESRDPSLSRVRRMARYEKADQARAAKRASGAVPPPTCDLRHGDFREVLADLPDQSVDAIVTDPPYPAEFLPLWSDLAIFARRVLKPDGLLVAMSGQTHLPAVVALLGEQLEYRWTVAYLTPGATYRAHARNLTSGWKPILVYGSSARGFHDVVRSDAADKDHHDWGQSESGTLALVKLAADPGALICDPFLGGGATAVAALAHGCSFVGAEIDEESYGRAWARVAA